MNEIYQTAQDLSAKRANHDAGPPSPHKTLPRVTRGSVLCGSLYLLSFLAFVTVLRRHFGFPLDDSWIHQVIARNLARYHVLGFIPGKVSSGSTSLLWTLILSSNTVLFPWLSPIIFCAALSGSILAGIGFSMMRIAEWDGLGSRASWCFALAPILSGNFLWLGLIGMEHLLFIFLSLACIGMWFQCSYRPTFIHRVLSWLLPFSLVLTRPEGFFLILLVTASNSFMPVRRKDRFAAICGSLIGMIVTFAMNWEISDQLSPPTMRGRQFLFSPNVGLRGRIYFLGQTFVRFTKTWTIQPAHKGLHGSGLLFGIALGIFFALLISLALYRLYLLNAKRILFLCAWGVLIELLYFALLPATGHGGRYIALPLMIFLSLLLLGLQEFFAMVSSNGRLVWLGMIAVSIATAVDSMNVWKRAAAAGIDQINSEHGEMAEWLHNNLSPDDFTMLHVAVFDIGRIGYEFHGDIVDLGGLVDSRYLPYLVNQRVAVYLRQRDIRYVVLPTGPSDLGFAKALALDREHGVTLSLVHSVCADPAVAELAMDSSQTAYPCQRLYAIAYDAPN